ncbi:uncharacterized protein HGUI_02980 [Hanseniaspora guilliermondii]|uniref:Telomerase activating protein Est1-like N-terminal domain-containing protein n=1 Tax=Hanseniaspora guilliermondii TaxID=56406 RepID=A0A1L0B4N9_9ASCO|nr:uncharacterized protein HGUI_02980 [Hanseniaspora guilliermondii]
MIELGNTKVDSSKPVHPFLKTLSPLVNDYMEGLKHTDSNSSSNNANSFPNSNHTGVGTIHKNLWNYQTNCKSSEDYIDIQSIWYHIHLPILKNFYSLKLSILKNHNIWNDNDYKKLREHVPCIVELRKLTNKYTKFFKKATEFYYSLLLDYIEVYYQIFYKEFHLSDELLARFNEEGLVINGNNDLKINLNNSFNTGSSNSHSNSYHGDSDSSSSNHANNNGFSPQHPFKKHMLFSRSYICVNDLKKYSTEESRSIISSTIYNICINIGTLNYYSAIIDTMNYKIQHFNKVLKWSTLGQFFEFDSDLSSNIKTDVDFSRHHLLKSSVYFKCDCYGYAVVCLLRSQQRESNNTDSEIYSMIRNLLDINGDQYKKILTHLNKLDAMNKDKGNRLIINKEIIEEYFLYCWNEILQNNISSNPTDERTSDFIYRFDVLKEKISIRYKKNILPIYINIILCFSGALFLKNSGKNSKEYYNFCLKYILFVLNNAILKEFQNYLNEVSSNVQFNGNSKNTKTFQNYYQYLAFVRVLLQFIYNDKDFFNVCIENNELMKQLAIFSNLCADYSPELTKSFKPIFDASKTDLSEFYAKPKRNYLYQEDLELHHWKDLALTDFNDNFKDELKCKSFLNYELLDEERDIMDIPNSKFLSKLESIVNRIYPLLNIFNNEYQNKFLPEEKLQIVDNKYVYGNGATLSVNSFLPSQGIHSNSITGSLGNNSSNGSSTYSYKDDGTNNHHYQKGKGIQRGSRPHSFLSREGSGSPGLFKQNSQRSYSSGSPTIPTNSSSNQNWQKRNSTSTASSPISEQKQSNGSVDSLKNNTAKPKMNQRAHSQPNINAPIAKVSKVDSVDDKVSKKVGQEAETNVRSGEPLVTPVSLMNMSNQGTQSSKKNVASPSGHGGLSVSNLNNMFSSWDTSLSGQQLSGGQNAMMDYASGYMNYSSSTSGYPMNGSGMYGSSMNVSDSNGGGSNVGYSNVLNTMNNFTFSPQPNNTASNGLKTSVSVSSFTGNNGNMNTNPSKMASSAGTSSYVHPSQAYNSTPSSAYGMYTVASSSSNTPQQGSGLVDSNSPGKPMGWMNTTQQPAASLMGPVNSASTTSGSIWETNSSSNMGQVPSSQMGMHNISRLNQFLTPTPSNPSSSTSQQQQSFRTPNSSSYIYNNFQQQRSQSQDHVLGTGYYNDVIEPQAEQGNQQMFSAQGNISNASRFHGVGQRPNSSAWFN